MAIDNPIVRQTERFGYTRDMLKAPATAPICTCGCGEECDDEHEYILGDDGRRFAETACVLKFFELRWIG